MKLSRRLALLNVAGVLALWALVILLTGTWDAQRSSALSFVVLFAAVLVVFWRVSVVYACGQVTSARAIAEGFVCGGAFAVASQVLFWTYRVVSGKASPGTVTNFEGLVNLLQQASYAGALGALLGISFWCINRLAIRRVVL